MTYNISEAEYLSLILGPRLLPLHIAIPLTLVYVTIFIFGITGNLITSYVIIKDSSLHSSTNFYLLSLAFSDLILLILGLPNELTLFWQQYPWVSGLAFCKIRAFISEMSSYVSILTILMLTYERYLAICEPFHMTASRTVKKPVHLILSTWLAALICALPFAVYTNINYVEYPPDSGNYSSDSAVCAMLFNYMPDLPLYESSGMIFFFIPMLIIIILYVKIIKKVFKSMKFRGSTSRTSFNKRTNQLYQSKNIVKLIGAVVLTFFICWAPFHLQRLLSIYGQDNVYFLDINKWFYLLSGCFYYSSTALNPLFYNFMSSKYKVALKRIFRINNVSICCN